jgi:hypothetical protein
MKDLVKIRQRVYENFPKENLNATTSPIVITYDINSYDYNRLVKATQNFLCKSLSLVYKKEFVWSDTFLEDNNNLIVNLPNKTPNGILNPKKETVEEFAEIQNSINNIFNKLNVYKHIKKLAVPNIRYKSVESEPEEVKSRPYYTGKMHSDAWVGHKGDSVFLIGVLGDISNNTVEFNNPIGAHDNYLDKAESFDEGNTRYDSLEYVGLLQKQTLSIMDHACAHKTHIKDGAKPRISIDIAVLIDSPYSHVNGAGFDEYAYNYYESTELKSIGNTKTFTVEESIFESKKTTINIK